MVHVDSEVYHLVTMLLLVSELPPGDQCVKLKENDCHILNESIPFRSFIALLELMRLRHLRVGIRGTFFFL